MIYPNLWYKKQSNENLTIQRYTRVCKYHPVHMHVLYMEKTVITTLYAPYMCKGWLSDLEKEKERGGGEGCGRGMQEDREREIEKIRVQLK